MPDLNADNAAEAAKISHLAEVYCEGKLAGYHAAQRAYAARIKAVAATSMTMGFLLGLLVAMIVVIAHRGHV